VVADYLPELGSKFIPALTALDVDQLTRVGHYKKTTTKNKSNKNRDPARA
jgi:hypothetical protein